MVPLSALKEQLDKALLPLICSRTFCKARESSLVLQHSLCSASPPEGNTGKGSAASLL